uniref:Ferripyochelin binding protein n=1 Tax=uncultured prokaryote TaxID=198431 RepID=H5SPY0_9ZZZZ|nr:ferripyochelin binding protein [uncultured prokaryote]
MGGERFYIHPSSCIMGDVRLGRFVSVFAGATLRADVHPISVGDYSNIQECAVIHVASHPVEIGKYVTIAHNAVIHACTIKDRCMIGINAVVLDGAVIGEGSIVGAGAVVKENTVVPPNSLVVGNPAVIKEGRGNPFMVTYNAMYYYCLAKRFKEGIFSFSLEEVLKEVQELMKEHSPS